MLHEQLCQEAYNIYSDILVRLGPIGFSPQPWEELKQPVREAYKCAVAAVQRSKTGSPKRDAHAAYEEAIKGFGLPRFTWEQPKAPRKAWARFTDFVIRHGQLN